MSEYTDLTVETNDPEDLDRIVHSLGAAVVVERSWSPDTHYCTVRVFGDAGFIKFAVDQQGYGRVVS